MTDNPIILYVEDDENSCQIMKIIVEDVLAWENLTIFTESSDFLQRIDSLSPRPTLVLLDIHVAPYTGFEMLEMLRSHSDYEEIPVIALTASVMNEEVQQLKQAGFDGVVAKPVDMDSFPQLMELVISGESVWHVLDNFGA